ncbi:indoleamine 2,3-dioxygenase [Polychaeton citri CBS 116435]|uniref:Indoleamine 2,3-dioxygenase n=1 Tax=Polychaeton citri CBS 116435 TaxID=1314669 RepID=A0A9P4UJR1_9PEZI|nr:indoleamine 2,3-dioxygenase [Polychaeton citri CBS 116435]
MLPSVPQPEDYDVSPIHGFLPTDPPLEMLPDSYYAPWEFVVKNLQGLILSGRLHEHVEDLPILTTDRLFGEAQWRRAYSVLAFIAHAYIWGGKKPCERVPPPITIPFTSTCQHLDLPLVATYSGLVLWNWRPIFDAERVDTLSNLDMIDSYTGSLDEKWFYLISVAIEARGGPIVPLMLRAIEAARANDVATVTNCLQAFAERLDDLGQMLGRMYDHCDPHVFYNRIRPYLAGSKNMAEAGLPNGVVFDNGGPMNKQRYVQYSGGSNAQSSLIQFFDIALGVEHFPTGSKGHEETKDKHVPSENFIRDMRRYMPGAHARFLADVTKVANIREFVQERYYDRKLSLAYDACLAMLSAFRDRHIQIVSRYIIVQSQKAKKDQQQAAKSPAPLKTILPVRSKEQQTQAAVSVAKKDLKGTGGTSLIPFLRQARDETGNPAVDTWARRLLTRRQSAVGLDLATPGGQRRGSQEVVGLGAVWTVDASDGGLCFS